MDNKTIKVYDEKRREVDYKKLDDARYDLIGITTNKKEIGFVNVPNADIQKELHNLTRDFPVREVIIYKRRGPLTAGGIAN